MAGHDAATRLHLALRRHGVLTVPDSLGRWFLGAARDEAVIEELIAHTDEALATFSD